MSFPPSARPWLFVVPFASLLASARCAPDPSPAADGPVGGTPPSFEAWKASLPRDPQDGAYLFEGDIAAHDDASLRELYALRDQPGALVVNTRDDGADDRWSDAEKTRLAYCVSPRFGDRHDEVTAAMESAASDWALAADVLFVHLGAEDASCTAKDTSVVFEVLPARGTSYTGRSFFPSFAGRGHHELFLDLENVDASAPKTLTGVLRHELGHVLGFRHEHARPESNGVCAEDPDFRPLTPYDPASVMHYNAYSRCAGSNVSDYLLTPLDRAGAVSLYGPPRAGS